MDDDKELLDVIADIIQDSNDQHGLNSYGAAARIVALIEEREAENYRSTVLDIEERR